MSARLETEVPVMHRVAVITGASRGIGAATALVLAKRGFRVVVKYRASARQAEEVVAAISEAGCEAVAIRADVTVPGEVAAMADETEKPWGRVDVLVHNAPHDLTHNALVEMCRPPRCAELQRGQRPQFGRRRRLVAKSPRRLKRPAASAHRSCASVGFCAGAPRRTTAPGRGCGSRECRPSRARGAAEPPLRWERLVCCRGCL